MKTSVGIFFKFFFVIVVAVLLASCSSSGRSRRSETASGSGFAVASWYGRDFHGRPTASGEIFDMHAPTCAHKAYPFGTQVRVTNPLNSRSATCTVNDRGPFVSGRDIDLSYAIAKEIGLIGLGTSRVFLEIAGRDTSYIKKVRVQAADRKGSFALQMGAFAEEVNAIRLKAALGLKYEGVYIEEATVRGTVFHRVRIGTFSNFAGAYAVAEQLGEEGYQPIIVKADLRI